MNTIFLQRLKSVSLWLGLIKTAITPFPLIFIGFVCKKIYRGSEMFSGTLRHLCYEGFPCHRSFWKEMTEFHQIFAGRYSGNRIRQFRQTLKSEKSEITVEHFSAMKKESIFRIDSVPTNHSFPTHVLHVLINKPVSLLLHNLCIIWFTVES